MSRFTCFILTLAFALGPLHFEPLAWAADWPRFRGPDGLGISAEETAAPVVWSESVNLKWKRALPGPGSSSPIVVGDRLFVTSWSGYGVGQGDPGDQAQLRCHLTCIDRRTGEIIWTKTVQPYLPEDKYAGMFAQHGYASHTPVSDGQRVYAYFGKTGALAFDMDGNVLWQQSVGTESDPHGWGSASSPILYRNLLIVTASAESEALVALDQVTGAEVWRQEASGFNSVWGTPTLVEVDPQRTDLVLAVPGEIWGLNPDSGKLRWYCKALGTRSFCSSAVGRDGIVYAIESGPGGGGGIAIRAGGTGDVANSKVVWAGRQVGRISSPLIYQGRIYTIARGIANCYDATTGDEIFRGRLKAAAASAGAAGAAGRGGGGRGRQGGMGGQDYSSPVLADGKIYFTSRGGDIHVFAAGRKFKQLAVNRVTREREDFSASPAVSRGELFIRSSKHLYCVAPLMEGDDLQAALAVGGEKVDSDVGAPESEAGGTARGQDRRGQDRPGRGGGLGRGGFDPVQIFKRRDADSDGQLRGAELDGPWQERLLQLDSDKDGAISLEEFQSGMRGLLGRGERGGRDGREGNARRGRPERPQRPVLDAAE